MCIRDSTFKTVLCGLLYLSACLSFSSLCPVCMCGCGGDNGGGVSLPRPLFLVPPTLKLFLSLNIFTNFNTYGVIWESDKENHQLWNLFKQIFYFMHNGFPFCNVIGLVSKSTNKDQHCWCWEGVPSLGWDSLVVSTINWHPLASQHCSAAVEGEDMCKL